MTWALIVSGLAMLVVGTWTSALHLALRHPSQSELEDLLEGRRGIAGPRTAAWLVKRRGRLSAEVALVRTMMRVGVTISAFLLLVDSVREVGQIAMAAFGAVVILWLATSVLSGALSLHVGSALIVRSISFLRLLDLVLGPIAGAAALIDEAVRRLSGANLREPEVEARLRRSIEDTTLGGGLDESAAQMLENVVEFTSTEVGTVMTPRTDIEGLSLTDDLATVRDFIIEAGHSRIPVFGENLDDIRGILYVKDLIPWLGTEPGDVELAKLLRQPIRVPETKPVKDLLKDFQRSEVHLAIVVDEYGGTSGLVTIEDVLEEIVGEIQDEHDDEEEHSPVAEEVSVGRWELDARFQIYDLNELLDAELPEDEDFDTVAGFILVKLGRVPEVGDDLEVDGLRFEVLEATATRIERVAVTRLRPDADSGEETAAGNSSEAGTND